MLRNTKQRLNKTTKLLHLKWIQYKKTEFGEENVDKYRREFATNKITMD
jgi:hypothetical protein